MREPKRWGDRRDGRRIRDLDGVHSIFPYLMPNRTDAEVYINEDIDVTALMQYLKEKNGPDADYKTTAFHAFVMALAKTVYHRPLLNRFIAGKRAYQRDLITMSFVVKRKFQDESEEILMTMPVKDEMMLSDISHKILGDTKEVRQNNGTNDMDKILNTLAKLPRFLLRAFMALLRFLDFHGWVPTFISDGDTNYSTVLLSNLGSIKCNATYHHLNNYGTNSIIVTIGEIHKAQIINADGEAQIRDIASLGVTIDERIADGFYFAKSVTLLKEILANPKTLEEPIKESVNYEY